MMLSNIFLKALRDRRLALFWWSFGFAVTNFLICSFYPTVKKSAGDLEAYIDNMPEAFKAAFLGGSGLDIVSPVGYLNAELFTLVIPIMFLIFAIGFGSRAIAGEEEDGTLDLLLSNPLPRQRVVLEKFLAMVLGSGLLGLVAWLSLLLGAQAFDMDVSSGQLAAATTSSVLLGLTVGTLALAVGCATGRKGMAVAVGAGFTTVSYIFNILTKIAESLESYEKLSLFYYQVDVDPLRHGLKIGDAAVFVGVIAVFLVVALFLFQRRDLAV